MTDNNPMNHLEALNDIAEPEHIGYFPLAPGWWLLIVIAVALLTYGLFKFFKRRQFLKQQRLALLQLSQDNLSNETIVSILKWAALQYFPRQQVAALFGQQFQQFLMNSLPTEQQKKFDELSASAFNGLYHSSTSEINDDNNSESFRQAALMWLTHTLAIKENRHQGAMK